jgi:hypothetical protein
MVAIMTLCAITNYSTRKVILDMINDKIGYTHDTIEYTHDTLCDRINGKL